jgi:hypothetical protein
MATISICAAKVYQKTIGDSLFAMNMFKTTVKFEHTCQYFFPQFGEIQQPPVSFH